MVFGDDAARPETRAHAGGKVVADGHQLRRRVGPQHALARVDERTRGLREQVGRALDRRLVARAHVGHPILGGGKDRRRLARVDHDRQQIVRDGEVDGTGASGHGGAEGGAHHLRQPFPLPHRGGVLGDRACHVLGVGGLPGAAAVRIGFDAAADGGEGDDRVAFAVRADQPGDHVAGAARRVADDDAGLACDARVALGDVHRRLFVACVDIADAVGRGVHDDRDVCAVDDAAHHLDAFRLQAPHQQFADADFAHDELLFLAAAWDTCRVTARHVSR